MIFSGMCRAKLIVAKAGSGVAVFTFVVASLIFLLYAFNSLDADKYGVKADVQSADVFHEIPHSVAEKAEMPDAADKEKGNYLLPEHLVYIATALVLIMGSIMMFGTKFAGMALVMGFLFVIAMINTFSA